MRDNKRGTIEDPSVRLPYERCAAHDRLHDCPAERHSVRAELLDPDRNFRSGNPVTVTIAFTLHRTATPPSEWAETFRRIAEDVTWPIIPGDKLTVSARLGI